MEIEEKETYRGGLKGYWRRRAYHRLDAAGSDLRRRRRRVERAELGGGERRRRPFWRVRIAPRLRFLRSASPRRWLAKIRDAYVRMMLGFASSAAIGPAGLGYGFGFGFAGDPTGAAFAPQRRKEYDEKVLVEIYRSILAQGPIVAAATAGVGAGVGVAVGAGALEIVPAATGR
ncbi:hypothetical protein ACMD2_01747 [Ananas comosus]|uniref:Uncharacterized protein n=1 Tax=Ananas comosus TaxID=4615 RepID=A0A199VKS2_ANACO|nr:hypothetical protein ACMD2_01747 [Ananas comosus]